MRLWIGRSAGREWATGAFCVLLAAAGAVLVWEGRDMTYFHVDDLRQFSTTTWAPGTLLAPFNGHLVFVSRVIFHIVGSIIGARYWVLQVLGIAGVLAADAVFFVLMRRRVGDAIALAASIPVLFLGSAWEALLWATGQLSVAYSTAAGLGAFLALEEDGRRRDLAACCLLILSLASFSLGIAFTAGVAVSVMLRPDRWRRAWVFVVPAALWAGWWLWARRFHQPDVMFSNLRLFPAYYGRAVVAAGLSLTGLSGLGVSNAVDFSTPPTRHFAHEWLLGLVGVLGVGLLLLHRRSAPRTLWPPVVALVTMWTLTGLAGRAPDPSRYALWSVILVLLIAAELARGIRVGRVGLAALYGGAIVMAALNLSIFQQGREFLVAYSENARPQLAMIELAGPVVRPDFDPAFSTPTASGPFLHAVAGPYLKGVAHYGSPADSLPEVETASAPTRQRADVVLAAALGLQLRIASAPVERSRCRVVGDRRAQSSVSFTVPKGGTLLRADRPSPLMVGRFGSRPTAAIGLLGRASWETLAIPVDRVPRPWRAFTLTAQRLTVCPLPGFP